MFEPPDPRDLVADVAEAARRFGHIELRATFWLSEKLAAHWNDSPERTLHKEGHKDWLTTKGLVLKSNPFEPTVRRARERWRLAREYARCRRDLAFGGIFVAVEIEIAPPRVCCAGARASAGVYFTRAQDLPPLPLPTCELDFCGCDYRSLGSSEFERETRKG